MNGKPGVLAVMDFHIDDKAGQGTMTAQRAELIEARATVERLAEACKDAIDSDGGTRYDSEDDEIGCRACCMVLSYEAHEADCWVPKMRAALAAFRGEGA